MGRISCSIFENLNKITDIGNILFNLNNDNIIDEKKDERKIKKIEAGIDKLIEVQEKKEEEEEEDKEEDDEVNEEDDDENDEYEEEDNEKKKRR